MVSALPISTPHRLLFVRETNFSESASVSEYLSAQWQDPNDILSVLLLLGPDIIQRAIAQLAGRYITPVAFSFGWVAYSTKALLSSVGDGRLMPAANGDSVVVVGAKSGHSRDTNCWVLRQLLRYFDESVDKEMQDEQDHVPPVGPWQNQKEPTHRAKAWEALRITVYEIKDESSPPHGVPALDWVWYSGFAVILIQLAISIVPWITRRGWDVFIVTLSGSVLALAEGSLPQWRREKWSCPRKGGPTVIITQGIGSRNAAVILGKRGVGLDLEILARGTRTARLSWFTRLATAGLAILWIILLVTTAGIQQNKWYLLCIGLLGSIQNIFAAGVVRKPAALGFHLKHLRTIKAARVAEVLKQVETDYPLVGTSLLDVFFPGSLRVKEPEDIEFWRAAMANRMASNDHGVRLDCLPSVMREEE